MLFNICICMRIVPSREFAFHARSRKSSHIPLSICLLFLFFWMCIPSPERGYKSKGTRYIQSTTMYFIEPHSQRMPCERLRKQYRLAVHCQRDAPNFFCRSNRRWATIHCGKRRNVLSANPCCRRRGQCLDWDIDRCTPNRDTRRTERIVDSFCPTLLAPIRPNCPDCVGIRLLKICSFCCRTANETGEMCRVIIQLHAQ